MLVGQERTELHHVCDQAIPTPGTEITETVLSRLPVAAVISRIRQKARSVEGSSQPVVARGMLGESVRYLYDALDWFSGLGPAECGDLNAVSGRSERRW